MGLVIRCVADDALDDATLELARAIVAQSWHSARANKWLYNQGRNRGYDDGLLFERLKGPPRGPDYAERIASFRGGKS
jgi:enoyl-CoA hydratase/carnithine racemase